MFDHRIVDLPYPGLRPFEPHESGIFFGREAHTDRLLEILQRERFLAVIGPSGGGKSSLVRAGLLPALAGGRLGTGSHWRLALFRPGGQPMLALATALTSRHALGVELSVEPPAPAVASFLPLSPATVDQATPDAALIASELRKGVDGLDNVLGRAQARRLAAYQSSKAVLRASGQPAAPPTLNLLVLADQFEEVFTYPQTGAGLGETSCFVNLLLNACRRNGEPLPDPQSGGIRVVVALTMRTDFLDRCVEFDALTDAINRAQYLTPRLKRAELHRAMVGPARLFGGNVDSAFADAILDEAGGDRDRLPMLQHAMAQWWREAGQTSPKRPFINAASTLNAGSLREALNRHAQRLYDGMPRDEQQACRALFRSIAAGREGDAVRRPQRLAEIAARSGVSVATLITVVARLAAADVNFVHHGHALDRESVIDLTHEALMRQWQLFKEWIADDMRRGQGWVRPESLPIDFVIPGQLQPAPVTALAQERTLGLAGTVKATVRVASWRNRGQPVSVQAIPGTDAVLLQLDAGPALLLHPESARDLMLGQSTVTRGAAAAFPTEVPVPTQLRWAGLEAGAATRGAGFLGGALLQELQVVTIATPETDSSLASDRATEKIDGQVDAGVYALRPDKLTPLRGSGLKLDAVPAAARPEREPLLVLIHGTFVDTATTFGKLWSQHPRRVRELFERFGGRVYALEHPTVGATPLSNALTLVSSLPSGARLNLLTHSRGGLVAEVLARVASMSVIAPADLAFFPGAESLVLRNELRDLHAMVRAKQIRVDRIVRVACPARGTLLASKRLDAYVSVLIWALQRAGVSVPPALMGYLSDVTRHRVDPMALPGLAAMVSDSPLLNWLDGSSEPIHGELRVVAGDLEGGDGVGGWLKTLMGDACYWTDNDLVVQTRSMYGGAPRKGGATFALHRSGHATHFNYFSDYGSAETILAALMQRTPAGFRPIGPLKWKPDAVGLLAAQRQRGKRSLANLPAVFVLPGMLCSHLKAKGNRVWLSPGLVSGLGRLKYVLGDGSKVQPDRLVGAIYDDLVEHLAHTHEVIPFAFDWRRPLEQEALRLAGDVERALDMRKNSGQAVRVLAHSAGGLLARTLQLERPATWARLMSHPQARLLMLGTPNSGSWSPMQVLSGDEAFGGSLATPGSAFDLRHIRQLMAEMPGFLQLQAGLLDPQLALGRVDTWKQIAQEDLKRLHERNWWHANAGDIADAAYEWGLPPQSVLDQACALRRRLDHQREHDLPAFASKIVMVVGSARFTPSGCAWGDGGFVYLDANDGGDGRVPLELALLPGVRTWTLDSEHGLLPTARRAFDAFVELLERGTTERLAPLVAMPGTAPGTNERAALVPSRPLRARPSPFAVESERSVFMVATQGAELALASGSEPLRINVLNGNLAFVPQALMLGHTRSSTLTGSEAVVNRLVGGQMQDSLDAGLYPDGIGSHQIFRNTRVRLDNPWQAPQPAMVIVVGLGDEGKLRDRDLAVSVRQAVIAWSQRMAESHTGGHLTLSLAATLMGSGGVDMTAGSAARAVAQGVHDANARLNDHGLPVIGQITFVELYLERATDAWHGLRMLAAGAPDDFHVAPTLLTGVGPLRRLLDSGYRGSDHDLLRVFSAGNDVISFLLDTQRGRSDVQVRAQTAQGGLLRDLLVQASAADSRDPRLGRTLFQLLVPPEIEPFLAGAARMLLELDEVTAAIPWEMVETPGDRGRDARDNRPWAIRTRLLRKLRQDGYRLQVQDVAIEDAVLVIGEPMTNTAIYPALPGARAEAEAVAGVLSSTSGLQTDRVTTLIGANAAEVINGLFERRFRMLHIVGYSEPIRRAVDGSPPSKGGIVLSDNTFLGADEVRGMRIVPELVFVNCGHLAAHSAAGAPEPLNRAEFACDMAHALIGIGVRCVIVTGWAVDNGPATVFATTFYSAILDRAPFADAVAAARDAAWIDSPGSYTWAAYQAYGDANWTYRTLSDQTATMPPAPHEEFDGVSSPMGLVLALEEVAVKSKWMHADEYRQREKVLHLEARFGALWGSIGAVAEAFAVAYTYAGDPDAAIAWYERALSADDASGSMQAIHQLGYLRARRAWTRAQHASVSHAELQQSYIETEQALRELRTLSVRWPTHERLALCGSTYKQLAILQGRLGHGKARLQALDRARVSYANAEKLATRSGINADAFYLPLNQMTLQLTLQGGVDEALTERTRVAIARQAQDKPDFWVLSSQLGFELMQAIAQRRVAKELPALQAGWAALHQRVPSPTRWAAVAQHFELVLEGYIARAKGAERSATTAMLALLRGYAKVQAG